MEGLLVIPLINSGYALLVIYVKKMKAIVLKNESKVLKFSILDK